MTGGECPRGICSRYGGMHQHAGVAVGGHHAGIAGLTLVRNTIEVENRTQWLAPSLAAPDIEVLVDIKVLVATDARNGLSLAAHEARDLGERGPRVEYRKLLAQMADHFQRSQEFVLVEVNQLRVFAVDERSGAERVGAARRSRPRPSSRPPSWSARTAKISPSAPKPPPVPSLSPKRRRTNPPSRKGARSGFVRFRRVVSGFRIPSVSLAS